MNIFGRPTRFVNQFLATAAMLLVVTPLAGRLCAEPPPTESAEQRIVLYKENRELRVYSRTGLDATYPVGLGFHPQGNKLREGDGATPEGTYSICIKNPHSRYYLSVGLNYPNSEDAERALAEGRISESQARAISRADQRGTCPPWNTPLGGEIFIHGRGSSSDWTLGCIALDDPNMKDLFDWATIGTEVIIHP